MKLLLDTHALLWWLADDPRLGREARTVLIERHNTVLVSVVSLWEIVVKLRVGKLRVDLGEVMDAVAQDGFTLLGLTPAHLQTLVTLPVHHRDPFDHLLIAQAITEGADFVSDDRNAALYPVRSVPCTG